MSSTLFRLPRSAESVASALVIEPHLTNLLSVLSTLSTLGFDTTVAETFRDAKTSLAAHRPHLLVTDVKLGEFNGLHLVLRSRSLWKDLPAIVTSEADDPVLRDEAHHLGATFVTLPTSDRELLAAIIRTVLRTGRAHPGNHEAIEAPFERRHTDRRQASISSDIERRIHDRRRDFSAALLTTGV